MGPEGWGGGGVDSAAGRILLCGLWLNSLDAAGIAPGGLRRTHGGVRPGGTQDERGEDSRNYLSSMPRRRESLGRVL